MKSNFDFLAKRFPEFAKIALEAEKYLKSDPNTSMYKSRLLVEEFVKLKLPRSTKVKLKNKGKILKRTFTTFPISEFNLIVNNGNSAVHNNSRSYRKAKESLNNMIPLIAWFYEQITGHMLILIKVRSY
ncbi:hypothetical protein [Paenibacillus silvisoli]|uniref:hypothetical protein n=1 Tax=Paenibacillus silvisoli TaxID=3110539 RepID=UPI0028065B0E|nr:hypothetical protein [Paenibacillus silvisoli]